MIWGSNYLFLKLAEVSNDSLGYCYQCFLSLHKTETSIWNLEITGIVFYPSPQTSSP